MKYFSFLTSLIIMTLVCCKQNNANSNDLNSKTPEIEVSNFSNDNEEIKSLIRNVLKWADSKEKIDLLPVKDADNDSIYVSFDLDQLGQNLDNLRKTNFFSSDFIDNYNQIILTLNSKLKDGVVVWYIGEIPPFSFASDVDPWCLCQDNLSWDNVEVEIINLGTNNAEAEWNWGKLNSNYDSSWKDFRYRFKVLKENSIWKISYMQGFDLKECTR